MDGYFLIELIGEMLLNLNIFYLYTFNVPVSHQGSETLKCSFTFALQSRTGIFRMQRILLMDF